MANPRSREHTAREFHTQQRTWTAEDPDLIRYPQPKGWKGVYYNPLVQVSIVQTMRPLDSPQPLA